MVFHIISAHVRILADIIWTNSYGVWKFSAYDFLTLIKRDEIERNLMCDWFLLDVLASKCFWEYTWKISYNVVSVIKGYQRIDWMLG